MKSILIILSSMILILPGCEKDSEVLNDESLAEAVALPTFSGDWLGTCMPHGTSSSYRVNYKFGSEFGEPSVPVMIRSEIYYIDEDCLYNHNLDGTPSEVTKVEYNLLNSEDSVENMIEFKFQPFHNKLRRAWVKTKKVGNTLVVSRMVLEHMLDSKPLTIQDAANELKDVKANNVQLRKNEWEDLQKDILANLLEKVVTVEAGEYSSSEGCKAVVNLGYPRKDYQMLYVRNKCGAGYYRMKFRCVTGTHVCKWHSNNNTRDLVQKSATEFYIEDFPWDKTTTFIKK